MATNVTERRERAARWYSTGMLLAVGLGRRTAAFILFLFNVMAVVFYPDLNANGVLAHQVYGLMLLIPLLRGPGVRSLDKALSGRLRGRQAGLQDSDRAWACRLRRERTL